MRVDSIKILVLKRDFAYDCLHDFMFRGSEVFCLATSLQALSHFWSPTEFLSFRFFKFLIHANTQEGI